MNTQEFLKLKEGVESKYRDDMAALERVWAMYHPGEAAPESPIALEEVGGGVIWLNQDENAAQLR